MSLMGESVSDFGGVDDDRDGKDNHVNDQENAPRRGSSPGAIQQLFTSGELTGVCFARNLWRSIKGKVASSCTLAGARNTIKHPDSIAESG